MDIDIAWWCWYLILMTVDFTRAQNPFSSGGSNSFMVDSFLELSGSVTTPVSSKSNNSSPSCVTNSALAGAIIGTLLLCAFIAFLTWMIYLRQKLQDLRFYENQSRKHQAAIPTLSNSKKLRTNDDEMDARENQLPLDVTDYKFGTFPFRQSQTSSINGHYNHTDWLTRIPSSFRSATADKEAEVIDIELLNPTFCGLNFSITGNMRAGIFVKEILDKETTNGQLKLNSSDQLKTGDRIMALTVCFESIVYEDALTILSYASPYPVLLRVQRSLRSPKMHVVKEKRPTATITNKVKWRDDFEHYDNDTSMNHSSAPLNPVTTLTTDTKSSSKAHHHSSSKKSRANKAPSTTKGNKPRSSSSTGTGTARHANTDSKSHRKKAPNSPMLTSTGLIGTAITKSATPQIATNKTTVKSVTNAVISYLHYRGANGAHATDVTNNSEATVMPYYDSPYDYYGANVSHSHLNRNNNNSTSTESLTAVTSLYTIQASPPEAVALPERPPVPCRCKRRLSSPARMLPIAIHTNNDKDTSLENIDTFV